MPKALKIRFNGNEHRSLTEAKWAVFLHAMGIPYEYEKQGFDLGEHGCYLPDFWLPTIGLRTTLGGGLWLEIKGTEPTDEEEEKAGALCVFTKTPVVIMVGYPQQDHTGYEFRYIEYDNEFGWDNCMGFTQCERESCGAVKIEFGESNYMVCERCDGPTSNRTPQFLNALDASERLVTWRPKKK